MPAWTQLLLMQLHDEFRSYARSLSLLFVSLLLANPLCSQSLPYSADVQRPIPGRGHDYINGLSETVNPTNGTLEIKIPFATPTGRKLSIPFGMQYDSGDVHRFHSYVPGCGDFSQSCSSGAASGGTNGWASMLPRVTLLTYNFAAAVTDYQTLYCPETSSFTFYDSQGGGHSLGLVALGKSASVGAGGSSTDCNRTANAYSVSSRSGGGDDQVQGQMSASCNGMWQDVSSYPSDCNQAAPAFTVTDESGTVYSFPSGAVAGWGSNPALGTPGGGARSVALYPLQIEDRNGNIANFTYQNGKGVLPVIDTLGRSVIAQTANGYQVGGLTYTLANTTTSAQYNVNGSQIPSSLNPRCTFGGAVSDSSMSVLQTLTLPNGQAYTFKYDSTYGLVNEIDYPDGGWVKYGWGLSGTANQLTSFNGPPAGASASNPTVLYGACNYTYFAPVVLSRTVGDGSRSLLQQTFSYSTTWNTSNMTFSSKATSITTVDLLTNRSKLEKISYGSVLKDSPDGVQVWPLQVPVEASVAEYDWGNTTTPLRSTTKTWADEYHMTGATVVWNNNAALTSRHIYCYAPGACTQAATQGGGFATPVITDVEYGYGSSSTPIRQTVYSYYPVIAPCEMLTAMSNAPPCDQVGVPKAVTSMPQSVIVKDGSGNRVSETDLTYDDTAPSIVANLVAGTHDECNFGVTTSGCSRAITSYNQVIQTSATPGISHRGNLTSITKWNNSGTSPVTKLIYDSTGQVLNISKPCVVGGCTDVSGITGKYTYSYADSFDTAAASGGQPSGVTNAYLTSETDPLGHTTSYTYAFIDGLLTSIQEPNPNARTSFSYSDAMRRLTETDSPAGGVSTTSYLDRTPANPVSSTMSTTVLASPDPNVSTTTVLDGFGRTAESQLTSAPGGSILTDTVYDGLGNIHSRSNPYQSSADQSYGVTTYGYDALGREITQTNPDSTTTQTCYNGVASTGQTNCAGNASSLTASAWVDSSDEAGKHWQRQTDALGRLVSVIEPNKSTGALAVETDYAYDPLNNLLGVSQKGVSGEVARNRTFSYDSLSRLLTASQPESGLTCYGVWSGGAVGSGTCQNGYDLNGNVTSKTDATNMTISFSYDGLDRVLRTTAPDNTNTNLYFIYDQGTNGIGRLYESGNTNYSNAPITNGLVYAEGGTRSSYDPAGRVTGTTRYSVALSSWQPGMSIVYNSAGAQHQLTYPDGRVITQLMDGAGHLKSVTDASPGGTAVQYIGGSQGAVTYWPSGAEQSALYGNGVTVTTGLNNRLQTCTMAASAGGPGGVFSGQLWSKSLLHNVSTATACRNEQANNGNIFAVVDSLHVGWTQSFGYDSLNRLLSANRSDGGYSYTYGYDSFGNMLPTDTLHTNLNYTIDPATNRLQLNNTNFGYDSAGKLATVPSHQFMYTAQGLIRSVDNYGTGSYVYNGLNERVFAVHNNTSWTDYTYLAGTSMAELTSDGTWTDYIYANGAQVARVRSQLPLLHLHGTRTSSNAQCGIEGPLIGGANIAGLQILSGDRLAFDFKQTIASYGGLALVFTDGTGTGAMSGEWFNSTGVGAWQHLVGDLTPYAGKTVQYALAGIHNSMPSGTFDLLYTNAAILHSDGTVSQIDVGQNVTVPAFTGNTCGGQSLSSATELTASPDPAVNTTYYLRDHLGTTAVETAGGGWPIWQGQFTPFGQEIINGGTQNSVGQVALDGTSTTYKFTGKERDAESGLDYFGARYYESSFGRWISPDWSTSPVPVPFASFDNPQSLNLYSYVSNNPLRRRDSDGHHQECGAETVNTEAKTGVVSVHANCVDVPDWWYFTGLRHFFGRHRTAVSITMNAVVIPATILSGVVDGGASELAVPEEIAVEEALVEGGAETAGDEAAAIAEQGAGQPASEQQALRVAKQIEKDLGKDARREFHDEKPKGAEDRTMQQLKEDARAIYQDHGANPPGWLK